MATAAAVAFAGKSVASAVIKEIITKGLRYLNGYFSSESMEVMRSKLERGMPKIQAVLDVVRPDQIKNGSNDLDAWLWQLRDAVEKAEDAIDELEYYELEEKAQNDRVSDWGSPSAKMKHKVVRSIKHASVLDKTVKQITHRGIIKWLKKAMEGLDKATEDITSILAVTEFIKGAASSTRLHENLVSNDRETGSMLSTTKFVGRKSEKNTIIEWLTKDVTVGEAGFMTSANYVPIFSLVGHGGMGKTTLAQSICQHDEVVKNFKIIWVTVSNIFDAKSVTRKILEYTTGNEPSDKHLEALQQDIKEKLTSMKFLLVLDDVWEDGKRSEWEKLFAPLRSGKSGSKILLTTRMISVADVVANVMEVRRDCLTLEGLENNENIELFNHHVFSGMNLPDYMHLKLTGEKIARKLGGCPLDLSHRLQVIHGHLEDIGERFLVQLTQKSFFDVKRITYSKKRTKEYYFMHDLMHELARGVSSGECTRITDPARITDVQDTVRHLCIPCIQECSTEERKTISKYRNLRSIIIDSYSVIDKDTMCELQKIVESSKLLQLFYSRLRITFEFSSKFGRLKHLRYIDMHMISSKVICSVSNLYHLIVLSCNTRWSGETKQIRYLGNLYHLQHVKYGAVGLGEFPISRLESIQELHNYCLQGKDGNKMRSIGNLQYLRKLDVQRIDTIENHEEAINAKLNEKCHLRSLSLSWSNHTGAQNRADELVLGHLEPHHNIRKLRIHGYKGNNAPCWIQNSSVGNLLRQIGHQSPMPSTNEVKQFLPPSLETLTIKKCPELQLLAFVPSSLVSFEIEEVNWAKLPKIGKLCSEIDGKRLSKLREKQYTGALNELEIIDCSQLEFAPIPFDEMNGLSHLKLERCPKLSAPRGVGDRFLSSSLKFLSIESCGDLEVASLGSLHVQQITNLRELYLKYCSSLVSLPSAEVFSRSFTSLYSINIEGCENLSSLGGLGSLSSLSYLEIIRCAKLVEVGSSQTQHSSGGEEERLLDSDSKSSLHITNLTIDLPPLLLVEPIRSLCHTEQLVIEDASEMQSLPDRWLLQNRQSLRSLWIWKAESLESLPPSIRDISSLGELCLSDARQLRSLPDLPHSLQELTLDGADQLCSLPHLPSSLKVLQLSDVGQLKSLPDLPSSMERLHISGCNSELKKKIAKYGSHERKKISHILQVQIGARNAMEKPKRD
uniref:NB-ARC domain-containing protein n=1 Tax=Leersia perrieri TaxID=77586 RepID=A0A0D9XXQ4_9ORYZ